jgi:uncharacterized membrane protein YdjX (TVP38/TMEM64 family)
MGTVKLDRRTIVKLVLLTLILSTIVIIGLRIAPWLYETSKNPQHLRDYIAGYGSYGFLVYILIQAVQVIIVIIPGDIVMIGAGFIYGIPLGFFLSYIGLMAGSIAVFYISRFFGYEFVSRIITIQKIEKINGILNSTRGTVGLFIICCIPFIPKDILMYVAGLTPINASRLFLVYGLSRIPTTLIWVSVGANAFEKDYVGLAITLAVMLVLLIIVFFIGKSYHKRELKN